MQRAIDRLGIGSGAATELRVRRRNGIERRVLIEKARVTAVIYINSDQIVEIDVPKVVNAQDHSGSKLALDSGIHLDRIRSSVIRSKRPKRNRGTARD